MSNENIDMEKNFEDNNLQYKDHQIFFNEYYQKKAKYNELHSNAFMDYTQIHFAVIALLNFIKCCAAQVNEKEDFMSILKSKEKIRQLILNKKYPDALNMMDEIYFKVCNICRELQIEPKPVNKEDSDEVRFWKEESHKGLREIKKGFMDVLSIKNG